MVKKVRQRRTEAINASVCVVVDRAPLSVNNIYILNVLYIVDYSHQHDIIWIFFVSFLTSLCCYIFAGRSRQTGNTKKQRTRYYIS